MELEDRFIHCASFSIFNSKKISANKDNTEYTYGVTGGISFQGTPDVKWQSIVYIKDTQQQWTHGQLYGTCSPDWEAEYGQNGYIKNKPFGIDLVHTEDITSADLSYDSSYEIYLSDVYDGDILYYEQDYNMEIKLLPLKEGATIYITSANYLEVEYVDHMSIRCHTVLEDLAGWEDYTLNIYRVHKLDDVYMPDTVIKTTEQTLSYNEQKQAISNIGLYNEVDYDTLKNLRDNSKLKPGCQYRIIDYITTTSQPNTQSAGHQFDIIVTADSENTLNEKARAIYHENDSYFSSMGVDMNAWQIWYCLDNDTERFGWAGGTDAKGVIYRMIDEWGNDCPYDFKNIMFKRLSITDCQQAQDFVVDYENNYYGIYYGAIDLEGNTDDFVTYDENFVWAYTFTLKDLASDVLYDYTTLNSIGLKSDECVDFVCRDNVIKEYRNMYLGVSGERATWLNNIVMFNVYTDISSHDDYADDYSFCYNNKFGNNCETITLGTNCYRNTFGEGCRSNIFGSECSDNNLRDDCVRNYFCNGCNGNDFDYICVDNTLGSYCSYNTFGYGCSDNIFMESCSLNTFGNECYDNTFGSDCRFNNFGSMCFKNSFGTGCQYNNFCTGCIGNELGAYYKSFTLGSNVEYVKFVNNNTGSSDYQVQNYKVSQGLKGLYNNKLNVSVSRNRNYETIIGRDSTGDVVQYCNADMHDITTWAILS